MQNIETLRALANELPDDLKANALALLEEMGTVIEGVGDDPIVWKPNYLKLVQGTTDRSTIPKGTAIGDMVLGETKLEQPFPIIPIRMWDGRQFWDPDQNSNRILCFSPDAKVGSIGKDCRSCPHQVWKEDGTPSDCGKNKTMLAISADLRYVFIISFAKSGYKIGMEFEGLLKKAGVQTFQRIYNVSSVTSATSKNVETYKIEVPAADKRRTPEALLPFLSELFKSSGADRKIMLEKFHEDVAARRAQQALATPAADPAALPAPEQTPALETAIEVPKEEQRESVSPMAKNYSI